MNAHFVYELKITVGDNPSHSRIPEAGDIITSTRAVGARTDLRAVVNLALGLYDTLVDLPEWN